MASTGQALARHAGWSRRLKEVPDPGPCQLSRAFRISRKHGCQGDIGASEKMGPGGCFLVPRTWERELWGWVKREEAEVGGQQRRRGPFGGTNGGHPPPIALEPFSLSGLQARAGLRELEWAHLNQSGCSPQLIASVQLVPLSLFSCFSLSRWLCGAHLSEKYLLLKVVAITTASLRGRPSISEMQNPSLKACTAHQRGIGAHYFYIILQANRYFPIHISFLS